MRILIPKNEKRQQNHSIVSKRNQTFKIGNYFDYDKINWGNIDLDTDIKSKILGITAGNLLIILHPI